MHSYVKDEGRGYATLGEKKRFKMPDNTKVFYNVIYLFLNLQNFKKKKNELAFVKKIHPLD